MLVAGMSIMGVAILLREEDRFLFELQKRSKWRRQGDGALRIGMGCIGGRVEEGESVEGALRREALEEIGCEIACDGSTHPFSIDPSGVVSPLCSESVPDGVRFVWEGKGPGFVAGGRSPCT